MDPHSLDDLEPGASLRILVELSNRPEGVIVTKLYSMMKADYGVGRTVVDKSRKALIESGIIEEYRNDHAKHNIKVINPTELGREGLTKLMEISDLLEKNRK